MSFLRENWSEICFLVMTGMYLFSGYENRKLRKMLRATKTANNSIFKS